jgi:SAM-dependent methyltransferase
MASGNPEAFDPYETIARFYDVGMRGFDEDIALYLGLAERGNGSVLELGCGTGRIMEPLLASGFSVTGIDRSEPMLRRARLRLGQRYDRGALLQGAIRNPPIRGRFDLVILAIDTMLHLETQAAQLDCLKAARGCLSRDGLLVIDLAAPAASGWEDWTAGVRPIVPAWRVQLDDGTRVDKFSTFNADPSRQTHAISEFYDCTSPDGTLRRTSVDYDLRFIFPGELDLLLVAAGLELRDRYGDYDLHEFAAGSERQICVATCARSESAGSC